MLLADTIGHRRDATIRATYAAAGMALGLGAPLGWLLLRAFVEQEFSLRWFVNEISRDDLLFSYLTACTCVVFAAFGYVLGNKQVLLLRQNRMLHHAATRDSLTGLYNRQYFLEFLTQTVAEASRYRQPLSLIMADLDHFKIVNDTYGHDAGDLVLIAAARTLVESGRESDTVARYGGEEFLIALPQTAVEDAFVVAERLREALAESVIEADGVQLRITCSAGVVGGLPGGKSWCQQAIQQADEAMYEAKALGRNRVVKRQL